MHGLHTNQIKSVERIYVGGSRERLRTLLRGNFGAVRKHRCWTARASRFFFQSIKTCWYICMQTNLCLTSSGLNRSDISWLAAFHVTYQNKNHPPHGLILWDEVVWGAQRFGIPLWPKELIFEVMKWSRLSCGWCFRLLLHLTVAGLEPQR